MSENALKHGRSQYRPGVGVMLLNRRGEVFVARRIDVPTEAWQMPQGGIDEGEDPRGSGDSRAQGGDRDRSSRDPGRKQRLAALLLPAELIAKGRHGLWRGQRQKWFVMRFTGDDSEINLEAEHPEFSAW